MRPPDLFRSILIAMIPLMPTVFALVVYMAHLDSQVKQNTSRLDSIDSGGSRLLQLLDQRLRTVESNYDRRLSNIETMLSINNQHLAVLDERQGNLIREHNEWLRANTEALRRLQDATSGGPFQNKITPAR